MLFTVGHPRAAAKRNYRVAPLLGATFVRGGPTGDRDKGYEILRRMEHLKPRPVGTSRGPRRVEPRERALVEWVANASPGDRMPEPWRWAHKPTSSVIVTLVDLGVIARPEPGADITAWKQAASAAARVWLEAHPADGGLAPGSQ